MNKIFLLIIACMIGNVSQAQKSKQVTHQQLYWLRYFEAINLGQKWRIDAEIEDRRFIRNNQQHQWLLPGLQVIYKINPKLSISAGGVYFQQTLPHNPEADSFSSHLELRPHQMLNWKLWSGKHRFKHRYWLEERFFQRNNTSTWDFNWRFRYLFQYSYKLKKLDKSPGLNLFVFDEIMLNAGKNIVNNTFDQNRIGGGFNVLWTKSLNTSLTYLNWFQQRASAFRYFNRHIVRLTVRHQLNW